MRRPPVPSTNTRAWNGLPKGSPTVRSASYLLARLAVDNQQQGKGLGKALLFDALSRIAEAGDIVAVRAVMVHAIDEAARRFYQHFEFEPSPVARRSDEYRTTVDGSIIGLCPNFTAIARVSTALRFD